MSNLYFKQIALLEKNKLKKAIEKKYRIFFPMECRKFDPYAGFVMPDFCIGAMSDSYV